jgi:hypothetical protein
MLVQLTRVGCTAMFQLPNRLVEFTVLIFVPLTRASCIDLVVMLVTTFVSYVKSIVMTDDTQSALITFIEPSSL